MNARITRIIGVTEPVRVIVFQDPENDDARWSAVALETDVWGFGATKDEALEDLDEMMEIQIEFAVGKKKPEMLDHPTEDKWFQLWDVLQQSDSQRDRDSMELAGLFCIEKQVASTADIDTYQTAA